ncbi:hypothetical protein NDU88_004198 [Pleurodeles waltl]|uniref:Uncharacterized protein n=1 Tax=Pleurodeles waltl TaxID=8319 RepID=A0AAV7UEU0_PLEWA|nr:hypothetical protein NDU88_004198 [Pleurodeles waltl]
MPMPERTGRFPSRAAVTHSVVPAMGVRRSVFRAVTGAHGRVRQQPRAARSSQEQPTPPLWSPQRRGKPTLPNHWATGTTTHLLWAPFRPPFCPKGRRHHRQNAVAALSLGAARLPRFPHAGRRPQSAGFCLVHDPRSVAIGAAGALGDSVRWSARYSMVTGPTCAFQCRINRSRDAELDQLASATLAG